MTLKELTFIMMLGILPQMYAQEENAFIRDGNSLYKSKKYTDAEIAYRKGLQKNPKSFEANYNLGNALYKQEKYAEALQKYNDAVPFGQSSKTKLAAAFHNVGNALLQQKKIAESIDAFKKSLKLNPKDDDTRYNLAYAQKLLKNQQKQKDQQKNQPKQEPQKKNEPKKDQSKQEQQIQKDKAQQILEALMQEEKETMEKARKQPKSSRKGTDKDW
jgi:tetratricopeptide (TPR) repeat protein